MEKVGCTHSRLLRSLFWHLSFAPRRCGGNFSAASSIIRTNANNEDFVFWPGMPSRSFSSMSSRCSTNSPPLFLHANSVSSITELQSASLVKKFHVSAVSCRDLYDFNIFLCCSILPMIQLIKVSFETEV